jgi:hypothetical protein
LKSLVEKPDAVSLLAHVANPMWPIPRTRRALCCLRSILFKNRSNRAEAVGWLVRGIANCGSKAEGTLGTRRVRRWKDLLALRGAGTDRIGENDRFMTELLVFFFSQRQHTVGQLVAAGGPFRTCILDFFSSVDAETKEEWFKRSKGSEALAKFAITNRNSVWQHLRWTGPRSHSPVAVAANPTYFAELDVAATVTEFVKHCPAFWTSEEVLESVKSGEIFAINPEGWAAVLRTRFAELRPALVSLVEAMPWKDLCLRLLPVLREEEVLHFSGRLLDSDVDETLLQGINTVEDLPPSSYLVFAKVEWDTFEDLVLAAACGCAPVQLLRMMNEAEKEEKQAWDTAVLELTRDSTIVLNGSEDRLALHWHLLVRCVCSRYILQCLAEHGEHKAIETMLNANGIDCVLHEEGSSGEEDDNEGNRDVKERGCSRRRKRRKRSGGYLGIEDLAEGGRWGSEDGHMVRPQWSAYGHQRRLSTFELLDAVNRRIEVACATWAMGREDMQ